MQATALSPLVRPALALFVLLPAAIARPAGDPPSFVGLGHLPGQAMTRADGISPDGSVVVGGTSPLMSGRAWRWSALEGLVDLGDLPPAPTIAKAMGASWNGEFVAGTGTIACGTISCTHRAWRWSAAGGMVSLGTLGGPSSWGYAISGDGSVVVGISEKNGSGFRAFRWEQGQGMVDLGLPAGFQHAFAEGVSLDGAVVVGHAMDGASTWHAWRWKSAGGLQLLGDLPGGTVTSYAVAASADGSVVVGRSGSTGGMEAFRWSSAEGMVGLGDLPGGNFDSEALGISGDGARIVGRSSTAGGMGGGAFLWDEAHGMRSLFQVLQGEHGLDLTGWILSAATAISADGRTIAGYGVNPSGQMEAWRAHLGDPPDVAVYCTSQPNSLGCEPSIGWSGAPSAGGSTPFTIGASSVLSDQFGLLFYGFAAAAEPFAGGTLCVATPLVRTPVQHSGGNSAPIDCSSGGFSFDMGAHILSGADPALVAGAAVHAQYWSRDLMSAHGTSLSDALRFVVAP